MSHQVTSGEWATPVLLQSWTFEPWVAVPIGLAAALYVCGWLRRRAPQRAGAGRLAAFTGGLAAIVVALESPLHPLAEQLLQAHMVQHLLLLMVAPPLIWLGTPLLPLLRGLPGRTLRMSAGRLLARPAIVRLGQAVSRPVVAWVAFVGSTWAWHTPALYEQALTSELWHHAQHVCFLATALAFWWPVVRPWPNRAAAPRGAIVLYLVLADLQNTVLSAWLVFAERVLYPAYAGNPGLWGMTGLDDQAAAGAIMWVPGSIAFLLPAAWIVGRMLSPQAGSTAPSGLLRGGPEWSPGVQGCGVQRPQHDPIVTTVELLRHPPQAPARRDGASSCVEIPSTASRRLPFPRHTSGSARHTQSCIPSHIRVGVMIMPRLEQIVH
jgi:cytochrome c oxidase assembly factor CtaG